MKKITLALLLVASSLFAAVPDRLLIVGTAQEIGAKFVTIRTATGPVKVPRKTIQPSNIRPGASLTARVTIDELTAANR